MTPPPYEVTEPFRANLRRYRRRAALSQEELAALASLHRLTIGLFEKGERLPRADTLIKLASSLEVTPNDLLDGAVWVPDMRRTTGSFSISR